MLIVYFLVTSIQFFWLSNLTGCIYTIELEMGGKPFPDGSWCVTQHKGIFIFRDFYYPSILSFFTRWNRMKSPASPSFSNVPPDDGWTKQFHIFNHINSVSFNFLICWDGCWIQQHYFPFFIYNSARILRACWPILTSSFLFLLVVVPFFLLFYFLNGAAFWISA